MNRKIRVAHVITRLCRGGAQENTVQTVRLINRERFDSILISGFVDPSYESPLEINEQEIPIIWEPNLVRPVSPRKDLRAFLRLTRLFREEKFDIVHTHTSKAGFIGRLAAMRAHVPILVHTPHGNIFHGYFPRWMTNGFILMEKYIAKRTDCLIELTQRGVQEHLERGIGKPHQWRVIFSGIDCEVFQKARTTREKMRNLLGLLPSHVGIGGIGRLEPIKGFLYFVEAAYLILRQAPHARFFLVGDGSQRELLEKHAKGLGDRFHFLGHCENIPEIMAALDVVVVPSLNEGMGRVILEAGASGLPVVASSVGGIPDVVLDGKTGILVPPRDVPALARAITVLIMDADLRQRMGRTGMLFVTPRFGVENMVKKIEEVYDELIQTKAYHH